MKILAEPDQKVEIHSWADRIDPPSLKLLQKLARWGRLAGPIAVMPDVHFASGVCVGTVLATRDCVLPTAIGEDLGCGMCSKRFEFDTAQWSRADLENLVAKIMGRVPTGRHVHREAQPPAGGLPASELSTKSLEHQKMWLGSRHLGTLGGGNHFIELQRDTARQLWVTVHSGSRGIGAAIAGHHAKAARADSRNTAPLPVMEMGSGNAAAFLADLKWALAFAAANRRRMLDEVTAILRQSFGAEADAASFFDVAHNLVAIETHGGRECVVHRKGAMPARAGQRGIIPGSMGTASYLVEGLGNETSYASCSHGAGRRLSRAEAHAKISIQDLRRQMAKVVFPDARGIERALIEEAPVAYKDIKAVLAQQEDLVRPMLRLEPLAVVKGA